MRKDPYFGNLFGAIDKAAQELPENFIIEMNVEKGALWVKMYHHGDQIWEDNGDEDTVADRYLEALKLAKEVDLIRRNYGRN